MKKAAWIAAAVLWTAQASAESQFGVEVYPGAKAEPNATKFLTEKLKFKNAAAYRTNDPVSKVADFYRKQPSLKEQPGTRPEGVMFSAGDVSVTIQNPWADMSTGTMMKDTLVSIVKK
jgi:hypothetical protein